MPVYEFLCRDCDSRFDDLVSMTATLDDQSCPECRSGEVVKLPSSFAVRSSTGTTISVDGSRVPSAAGRSGGCCGGGCGGCG